MVSFALRLPYTLLEQLANRTSVVATYYTTFCADTKVSRRPGKKNLLALAIIVITLTVLIFVLRVWSVWHTHHQFYVDDWLCFIAVVFMIAMNSCVLYLGTLHYGEHYLFFTYPTVQRILHTVFSFFIMRHIALCNIRLSLIVLLNRIFGANSRTFQICAWAVAIIIVVTATLQVLMSTFNCWPVKAAWDWSVQTASCRFDLTYMQFCFLVVEAVMDFLMILLPVPWLLRLNLERKKKFWVVSMYSLGFLGLAVLIVDIVIIWKDGGHTRIPWNTHTPLLLVSVEGLVMLTCFSLPAVRSVTSVYLRPWIKRHARFLFCSSKSTRSTSSSSESGDKSGGGSNGKNVSLHRVLTMELPNTTGLNIEQGRDPLGGDPRGRPGGPCRSQSDEERFAIQEMDRQILRELETGQWDDELSSRYEVEGEDYFGCDPLSRDVEGGLSTPATEMGMGMEEGWRPSWAERKQSGASNSSKILQVLGPDTVGSVVPGAAAGANLPLAMPLPVMMHRKDSAMPSTPGWEERKGSNSSTSSHTIVERVLGPEAFLDPLSTPRPQHPARQSGLVDPPFCFANQDQSRRRSSAMSGALGPPRGLTSPSHSPRSSISHTISSARPTFRTASLSRSGRERPSLTLTLPGSRKDSDGSKSGSTIGSTAEGAAPSVPGGVVRTPSPTGGGGAAC
jgi:hypothetical protein